MRAWLYMSQSANKTIRHIFSRRYKINPEYVIYTYMHAWFIYIIIKKTWDGDIVYLLFRRLARMLTIYQNDCSWIGNRILKIDIVLQSLRFLCFLRYIFGFSWRWSRSWSSQSWRRIWYLRGSVWGSVNNIGRLDL